VLLVEDDDVVAKLVGEMLSQLGYHVLRTASAGAALGVVADRPDIDLVFSDIMMPGGMDGISLARELRKRRPGLPVVLTTGHHASAASEAAAEGLQVLAKPYRLHELRRVLSQARGMGSNRVAMN
jgi:CheY-like chemotaxis protein